MFSTNLCFINCQVHEQDTHKLKSDCLSVAKRTLTGLFMIWPFSLSNVFYFLSLHMFTKKIITTVKLQIKLGKRRVKSHTNLTNQPTKTNNKPNQPTDQNKQQTKPTKPNNKPKQMTNQTNQPKQTTNQPTHDKPNKPKQTTNQSNTHKKLNNWPSLFLLFYSLLENVAMLYAVCKELVNLLHVQ